MKIERLVDRIYKTSILKYFTQIQKIDNPHFAIGYVNTKNNNLEIRYESMDHFTVQAKMQTRYLKTLEKNYDINTNDEFINTIIIEGNKQLNNYFIDFIDKNSDILEFPLYKISKLKKIFRKFLKKNFRFSIKNKKININTKEYIKEILENIIKESLSLSSYEDIFIIVSEDLIDLLEFNSFSPAKNNSLFYYGSIKHIGPSISVFINKKQPEKTLYFGFSNPLDSMKLRFSYFTQDSALTEHYTPTEKVYRLNLYHKLVNIDQNQKFKKIIFNDNN